MADSREKLDSNESSPGNNKPWSPSPQDASQRQKTLEVASQKLAVEIPNLKAKTDFPPNFSQRDKIVSVPPYMKQLLDRGAAFYPSSRGASPYKHFNYLSSPMTCFDPLATYNSALRAFPEPSPLSSFSITALKLASINRKRKYNSLDNNLLNPQKKPKPVPEEQKDSNYWERRRKNNDAAKRSRDSRRAKEDEIALRAVLLEKENMRLRAEVTVLKNELARLHYLAYSC